MLSSLLKIIRLLQLGYAFVLFMIGISIWLWMVHMTPEELLIFPYTYETLMIACIINWLLEIIMRLFRH